MAACEQIRAAYPSDPDLRRIPCYTLLHHTEVLSFNCGLCVAKYRQQLLAMKNKTIDIDPIKPNQSSFT